MLLLVLLIRFLPEFPVVPYGWRHGEGAGALMFFSGKTTGRMKKKMGK